MSINQTAEKLVQLCEQAPQEINSLLPEGIKTQLVSMGIFEQGWENIGGLHKKLEISTLLTTKDLREVTRLYLQRCSKEALPSLLGLDSWQTTGNKQEACGHIIDCLINSDVILSLNSLGLSSLPKAITQLSHLQQLSCINNQLTSLPDTIGQLSNLQKLKLYRNRLTCLPESIGQLSKLQGFDCSYNELISLPNTIAQLSNLQNLKLLSNKLTSLPESIGQLSKLQELDCSENRLTSLPESIGQLSKLQDFYCYTNELTSLPEAIGQLSNLAMLQCSHNQLTFLPEAIGQLSNLNKLCCTENQLISLPETIGQLSDLEVLNCFNNRLTSLPESIGQLSNLRCFYCDTNLLTSLPESIGQLANLKELRFSYNRTLTSLPLDIFNLSLRCNIEITGTGLSESVLQRIQERVLNSDYRGPCISYSIRQNVPERPKSLNELLNTLYAHLGRQVPEQLAILSENSEQAESFHIWLQRLSLTADGQNIKEGKKAFYIAIADIIEFAATHTDYRTLFHTIVLDASATCGDRMTLSIIQLEIAKQEITIDKTDLLSLADFLKRGYLAMQMLEKIAREKTLTLRFFDEVEVYLAYPIQLKDDLKLPFSAEKMLFMRCSGVTDEDLQFAKKLVQTELDNQESVVNFLIKNSTWIEALKGCFPETVETIQQAAIEEEKDPADAYRTLTFEAISRKRKAPDDELTD